MKIRRPISVLANGLLLWFCIITASAADTVRIEAVLTENAPTPLGIDTLEPRFSWVIASNERKQKQTAYQIRVASSPEKFRASEGKEVQDDGADFVRNEPGYSVYEAGSGNYRFTVH